MVIGSAKTQERARPMFLAKRHSIVYERARELIEQWGVFRPVEVLPSEDGGSAEVVIHGVLKIGKAESGELLSWKRAGDGSWGRCVEWGELRIPAGETIHVNDKEASLNLASEAISIVLARVGYHSIPRAPEGWYLLGYADDHPEEKFPSDLGLRLMELYLGRSRDDAWPVLNPVSEADVLTGYRELRRMLRKHFLGRVASEAARDLYGGRVGLDELECCLSNKDTLVRIAKERPNLIPLLQLVDVDSWGRTDLFSREVWVGKNRRRPKIDSLELQAPLVMRRNARHKPVPAVLSLQSRAAMKWLFAAPSAAVRGYAIRPEVMRVAVEHVAHSNITVPMDSCTWLALMACSANSSSRAKQDDVRAVYRLFALWAQGLIEGRGVRRAEVLIAEEPLNEVVDWVARVGLKPGQPGRGSGWRWMRERALEYHARLREGRVDLDAVAEMEWRSRLRSTTVDGNKFVAMTSGKALIEEGRAMGHCVADYAGDCYKGQYRVFSCSGYDGSRSTLGIARTASGQWVVNQHYGPGNRAVGQEIKEAGELLASRYA